MAAAPYWKVYDRQGQYRGATKHVEDAACLAAFVGDGAEIRAGHRLVVWREGAEEHSACESYDATAAVIHGRVALRSARRG